MDAVIFRKNLFVVLLSLVGYGCSPSKTASSVFPDNAGGASAACSQQASENRFIVHWEDGSFTVENDQNADHFRKGFVEKNLNLIKHVDRDVHIKIRTRSNEDVQTQAADSVNWGQSLIQAETLWARGIKGEGVIVGVVDGMVDTSHQQLQPNILVNTREIPNNGIDDDGNGFIDDYMGVQVNSGTNNPAINIHGSHVAGIIAAIDDSTKGPVVGVAPKSKIVPAQFIGNDEGGSIGDAIVAMKYVVSRGAKIINLSWGGGPCVEIPSLKAALQQISDVGVLVVTAAGNGDSYSVGVNMDIYPAYPSAYNFANQINVAATTIDDYMISFSNYGARTVHVAAPGVSIYSTIPGNLVRSLSGTSMAAPMVSGAAALIWGAFPTATASQVKQALLRSVDVVPGRNLEVSSRGRINVVKAYNELNRILGN